MTTSKRYKLSDFELSDFKIGDIIKIKSEESLMKYSKYANGIPKNWGTDKRLCTKFMGQKAKILSFGAASIMIHKDLSILPDQVDYIISSKLKSNWRHQIVDKLNLKRSHNG